MNQKSHDLGREETSWKPSQKIGTRDCIACDLQLSALMSAFFPFFLKKHFLNQQHAARLSFQTATVNFHNYRELPSVMLISVNMSHGFKPKDYSFVLTDAFLLLPFCRDAFSCWRPVIWEDFVLQLLDRKRQVGGKKIQCAVMGGKGKLVLCLLQLETLELVSWHQVTLYTTWHSKWCVMAGQT